MQGGRSDKAPAACKGCALGTSAQNPASCWLVCSLQPLHVPRSLLVTVTPRGKSRGNCSPQIQRVPWPQAPAGQGGGLTQPPAAPGARPAAVHATAGQARGYSLTKSKNEGGTHGARSRGKPRPPGGRLREAGASTEASPSETRRAPRPQGARARTHLLSHHVSWGRNQGSSAGLCLRTARKGSRSWPPAAWGAAAR